MLHTIAHPSRLSLIYECCPVAYLVEKAGGKATDAVNNILDLEIVGYQQKVNFIAGSAEDVEYISDELNSSEENASGKKGSYNDLLNMQKEKVTA